MHFIRRLTVMKKKICALLLTFLMMFAFSVNCLAWVSPTQTAVPTKETKGGSGSGGNGGNGGGSNGGSHTDHSSKSPKTGMEMAGVLVAVITASGVALIARRKFTEE